MEYIDSVTSICDELSTKDSDIDFKVVELFSSCGKKEIELTAKKSGI